MRADGETSGMQRLDEVLKLVRAKIAPAQRAVVEEFTERYFQDVEAEDLAERQPADLYGAALSHWNFARKRDPGRARILVFNPTLEEHGWQSTHTIIEIVNDDMPFLVDSVTMEVNRHGLTMHLIIHPIVVVERRADGTLAGLPAEDAKGARRESFIHVEVDRITEPSRLEALAADIARVLDDVRAAVDDWQAMRDRLQAIVGEVEKRPPPLPAEELSEGKDFLRWLAENHFTFLGYRCHELAVVNGEDVLKIVPGSSLGILREGQDKEVATSFSALPPEVRAYARRPELLVVTKATSRSTVHRPGYLDYIAVKRFNAKGEVAGEDRFLGLFTSTAYSANPADIPLLRRKVANIVKRAGLPAGGHAGKTLVNILDRYPRHALEARLAIASRRWEDDLKDALIDAVGEARGNQLYRQFGAAFAAGYREEFAARAAVPDIEMMAKLTDAEPLGMSLYRPREAAA